MGIDDDRWRTQAGPRGLPDDPTDEILDDIWRVLTGPGGVDSADPDLIDAEIRRIKAAKDRLKRDRADFERKRGSYSPLKRSQLRQRLDQRNGEIEDAVFPLGERARESLGGGPIPHVGSPDQNKIGFGGSGDFGRGGLGSGNPYGKGETFSSDGYSSGRSASPFTSGTDRNGGAGTSSPFTSGSDTQAPYNQDAGGSGSSQVGSVGSGGTQGAGGEDGGEGEQGEQSHANGSDGSPQNGESEQGTPTYEGNEKGWVSAQDLNRIFQLIGGGNGARGTPGGIRNDAQQPGPSVSGFGGVSNPLAPYIRTTGEEGTRRFGGQRGGVRGVDPRNIRSDNAGWRGSSRSVREVDTASFGPRDKFGGGSPIGPDPNARNPFETRASVVSKNRR